MAHETLKQFAEELMCASGVDNQESSIVSATLLWMDLVGRKMQGVIRLPQYLKRFKAGSTTIFLTWEEIP